MTMHKCAATILISTAMALVVAVSLGHQARAAGGGTSSCDPSLWKFVYHPNRLTGSRPCITVTGTIHTFAAEIDGDFHLGLRLPASSANLLNAKNMSAQKGDLVVEAVCQGRVTQTDVIDLGTCDGYSGPHYILSSRNIGQQITVTGTFVSDGIHGWNEVHPITSASLGATASSAPSSALAATTASSVSDDLQAAKGACGSDVVVWVNTRTGLYHQQGSKWFGNTTQGAYMCKQAADGAGYTDAGD